VLFGGAFRPLRFPKCFNKVALLSGYLRRSPSFHFWNLARAVTAHKAGIPPTFQTYDQKVVTSTLPTPIVWSKLFTVCFFPCGRYFLLILNSREVPRNPAKSRKVPRSPAKSREVPRSPAKSREVPRSPAKSGFVRMHLGQIFMFLSLRVFSRTHTPPPLVSSGTKSERRARKPSRILVGKAIRFKGSSLKCCVSASSIRLVCFPAALRIPLDVGVAAAGTTSSLASATSPSASEMAPESASRPFLLAICARCEGGQLKKKNY
jgi:hypothetical protein